MRILLLIVLASSAALAFACGDPPDDERDRDETPDRGSPSATRTPGRSATATPTAGGDSTVTSDGPGDETPPANGGGSGGETPVPPDRRLDLAPIDELDLIIRESFPPQYAVRIVSGLPSGCALFHAAVLEPRQANTFTIRVQNTLPADANVACTAIYGMHESIVELGSDLTPGADYVVRVNDKELAFTAQ
jgi:hypothetical protein